MKRKPWRKYLVKAELQHLKDVHVKTKKDFIELNEAHNRRRNTIGTWEPCYQCKTIAQKLGLEVVARGKLVVVPAVEELNTKTKYQAVRLVDNNKPVKEVRSMRIIDIKNPILRRLALCGFIVPCVVAVIVINTWQQFIYAIKAGYETFTELWEGYNGNANQ
jgi:hypothetical protein